MTEEQRWTTESVPVAQQFDYWREACARTFFDLKNVRTRHGGGFRGSFGVRRFGAGLVSHIEADPVGVVRSTREIARSPSDLMILYLQDQSTGLMRQRGRDVLLHPGDLALFDPMIPLEMHFADAHRALAVQLPRGLASRYIAKPEKVTALGLSGSDDALGALLSGFVRQLVRSNAQRVRGSEQALLEQVTGLLALAVGATEAGLDAGRRGMQAALRAAALRYIARELDNPGLTPGVIARHLSISVRSLHYVFAEHEASVERWIQQCRLDRAHDVLGSCAPGDLTVSEVAAQCGFTDLSHFSRAFRQRYGTRPRDVLGAYRQESVGHDAPSHRPSEARPQSAEMDEGRRGSARA